MTLSIFSRVRRYSVLVIDYRSTVRQNQSLRDSQHEGNTPCPSQNALCRYGQASDFDEFSLYFSLGRCHRFGHMAHLSMEDKLVMGRIAFLIAR